MPIHIDADFVLPSLVICRFKVPLYYGNAEFFMDEALSIVRSVPSRLRWFVLRFDSTASIISPKMLMELDDRMANEQVALVFAELSTMPHSVRRAPVRKPGTSSCFRVCAGRKLDQVRRGSVRRHQGHFRQVGRHSNIYIAGSFYRRFRGQNSGGQRGYRKRHKERQAEGQELLRCPAKPIDHV